MKEINLNNINVNIYDFPSISNRDDAEKQLNQENAVLLKKRKLFKFSVIGFIAVIICEALIGCRAALTPVLGKYSMPNILVPFAFVIEAIFLMLILSPALLCDKGHMLIRVMKYAYLTVYHVIPILFVRIIFALGASIWVFSLFVIFQPIPCQLSIKQTRINIAALEYYLNNNI